MDYTCRTKTLQSITKDIAKEKIMLSHKLQRKEGQWNNRQKSDLIDSLLRKYPINPTYGIKADGIISIIDGVQRLSTIRDYLEDNFSLSKSLEPVMINGEEKDIAGKKFSKLDEDTQDTLRACELELYELTECTEKDVREMFRRQNAGKSLNGKQLRVVHETDELSDAIYSLSVHPFMDKILTKTQRKNATDRDLIIQTLMLIETNNENDFTSFRSKDMDKFVIWYSESMGEEKLNKISVLNDSIDKLDESLENASIAVTSIPIVLYSAYRVIKDKKSFSKFIDLLKNFMDKYDENNEYKAYCQSGTSSTENVRGRLDYFRGIIRNL